jgi:hypothetical protein
MTCEVSWNLGVWRGERRLKRDVPLATVVDLASYHEAYVYALTLPTEKRGAE